MLETMALCTRYASALFAIKEAGLMLILAEGRPFPGYIIHELFWSNHSKSRCHGGPCLGDPVFHSTCVPGKRELEWPACQV